MPYRIDDVDFYVHGLSEAQKEAWVKIANNAFESTGDEAKAVSLANELYRDPVAMATADMKIKDPDNLTAVEIAEFFDLAGKAGALDALMDRKISKFMLLFAPWRVYDKSRVGTQAFRFFTVSPRRLGEGLLAYLRRQLMEGFSQPPGHARLLTACKILRERKRVAISQELVNVTLPFSVETKADGRCSFELGKAQSALEFLQIIKSKPHFTNARLVHPVSETRVLATFTVPPEERTAQFTWTAQ